MRALSLGSGGGGPGVTTFDRFDDHAVADGLGADLDADDRAVDDGANGLNVRPELSGGDARDLRADAAEVFGFAAVGFLVTERRLLTGEIANAWHGRDLFSWQKIEPSNVVAW